MSDSLDSTQIKRLSTLFERLKRLNEEKKGIAESTKEVLAEAKSAGFEPKYITRAIKEEGEDPQKRIDVEAHYQVYKTALGIQ